MKYFIFLILCFQGLAQRTERTLIIKDADSKLPIEDATVFIVRTKQTLISNSDGIVHFVLNGNSNIQISHTSYVSYAVRSSTLKEAETEIFLKNNVNDLDEIVLTKQHPQKILKSLVANSIKKLTVPARLKVYCREFFKLNGNYSYYNDGIMNFQLFDKAKKFSSNILVEQNRSIGLIDEEVSKDLLGYNLNNIMENYYNFKYLNELLEPRAKKEYDFLIKVYLANKEYYVINATPLENTKGLLDDYSIVYDPKKKMIIEVSAALSPVVLARNEDKSTVGSKNIVKSYFKTTYRIADDDYYLVCSKEEIGFEKIEKAATKSIEVRNYFVTTNFSNQNYSYKESDVFKDKTLFNKKNVILSDFWNVSGLTATEDELNIINEIEDEFFEE